MIRLSDEVIFGGDVKSPPFLLFFEGDKQHEQKFNSDG